MYSSSDRAIRGKISGKFYGECGYEYIYHMLDNYKWLSVIYTNKYHTKYQIEAWTYFYNNLEIFIHKEFSKIRNEINILEVNTHTDFLEVRSLLYNKFIDIKDKFKITMENSIYGGYYKYIHRLQGTSLYFNNDNVALDKFLTEAEKEHIKILNGRDIKEQFKNAFKNAKNDTSFRKIMVDILMNDSNVIEDIKDYFYNENLEKGIIEVSKVPYKFKDRTLRLAKELSKEQCRKSIIKIDEVPDKYKSRTNKLYYEMLEHSNTLDSIKQRYKEKLESDNI